MKQTVEEAARTHWSESTYNKDAELAYDERDNITIKALAKSVALRAFKKGADWQQVRIQAAIAAMNTLITCYEDTSDKEQKITKRAVQYADALVEELKKKGE